MTVSNSNQNQSTSQLITFSDVEIKNLNYPYQDDLIVFHSILSEAEMNITLERFILENITFERGGNLIKFGHQHNQYIEMKHSTFTDIVFGGITQESFFNQMVANFKTRLRMTNITTNSVNALDTRFISLGEGAILEILNSSLSTISSLRPGSAIYAGDKQTSALISDTTFTNNTSTNGGVFNSESESHIS